MLTYAYSNYRQHEHMKNIVIVGGGFGGIKAALDLDNATAGKITLISDQADFRYYPSLYRTATGGRRTLSTISLKEIFAKKGVEIVIGRAVKLDRVAKTLTLIGGEVLIYDYLVLALGVQTNYFGIDGLEEYSYGIKSTSDAEKLKTHLHQQMIDNNQPDLNYVVVGGGPTGVELAGVLPAYLKAVAKKHGIKRRAIRVELVEATPRLVPRMPKDMSYMITKRLRRLKVKLYLGSSVKAESAKAIKLDDREIASQTVIWTAGVANQPFFADNDFQLTKNGKVRVDQFLQSEQNIYVIGDNADTPYSGMAQTALYDGAYVADIIYKQIRGEQPSPYKAKKPIYVLPAGPRWAAVLWGNFRIYGWLGWTFRRLADLIAYHDFEPWRLATKRWMSESDSEEFCPVCSNL